MFFPTRPIEDVSSDLLSYHAEETLRMFQSELDKKMATQPEVSTKSYTSVGRVAVIGAGVSGLRLAMQLGLDHEVDVYEASERVGGRLFTHEFDNAGTYDYFDVGAMRFPNTKVMTPTFDLFKKLDLKTLEYHMQDGSTFRLYNGIRKTYADTIAHNYDFGAGGDTREGKVPRVWAEQGYSKLMEIVFARFLHYLRSDHQRGYQALKNYDEHSTRTFMAFVELPEVIDPITGEVLYEKKDKYPAVVINWLETMNFSVGWFDRAFVETALELLAFAAGDPGAEWKCVDLGSQKIAEAMKCKLEDPEVYNGRVKFKFYHQSTTITYDPKNYPNAPMKVSGKIHPHEQAGHVRGTAEDLNIELEEEDVEPEDKTSKGTDFRRFSKKGYTHVILAVSPQCMRYLDLSTCNLDYGQRSAILMLLPGPSTKIGIKFKSNWWYEKFKITGGQSTTDRTVRTVVYPSYGENKSTVLIASYCWTQDAASMGSLMHGKDSLDSQRLRDTILNDLAEIHGLELSFIKGEFEDWFAFDWAHNPKTMGAYAFFGPSQFTSLFNNLTRPAANQRLHFAGEAISTCHAWVAGAIDSADRVLLTMFPPQRPMGGPQPINHGPDDDEPQATDGIAPLISSTYLLKQVAISQYLQGIEV